MNRVPPRSQEMTGGEADNGRLTAYALLSCMLAASGGILFGYDLGISGGVSSMDHFLLTFFPDVYAANKDSSSHVGNYCKFNSPLLTAFTSSLYIAALFASLLASHTTRVLGRRPSIVFGGAVFLAGAAAGGAARDVYTLILSRILLGVGIGFTNQAVPLYLSEIAPPRHRGAVSNAFEACVGVGILFANLVNYGVQKIHAGWGWRLSLSIAALPAATLTIGALFLPETPASVLQRSGDVHKATVLLQRIRGTINVHNEVEDLVSTTTATAAAAIQRPFRKLLQRRYRPQLVMAIAIPFFQNVTGIGVITLYSPLLFRTIGFKESASLMSVVVTRLVFSSSNVVAMSTVDRLGRRTLFIVGGAQILISQGVLGGVFAAQLGDHDGMSKGYAYLVLVGVCVYLAGFALSWGPLGFLVPSEIFPLEVRSAGMSIVVAVGLLFLFVLSESILAMLCSLKFGVFFFFMGWVLAMTTFVYLLLPETKGIPMEQMEVVWREHWFWRRIVGDHGGEGVKEIHNAIE